MKKNYYIKKSIFIIFLVLLHMSFSGNSQDYNLSNVTVSPNDKFTITTSPDCNGLGNGSITIDYNGTFSNLNLPISIELSNIFEDSSNPYYMDTDPFTIENLSASLYKLEIFFSPECKYLGIIQIEARNCKCDEKIVIENIKHLICGNAIASIDVDIPSISDSEIVYNWYFFNDNTQEWELYCPNCGDKMSGIKKGLWKVEALYYNCVNSLNFTILDDEDINKLKFSYGIVIPVSSCTPNPYVYNGYYTSSDDGAVCVNVTPKIPEGGKIKWSNGEYGTCNYNLGAGTYTVYLEISGCEIELGKVELCCCYNTTDYPNHPNIPFCTESENGNPVPIEMTSVVKSSYNNDGSIKLTITPNSACVFKWSPPKGNKSFIEGLSPGTYCVTVTTECSDYTLTDCFKVGDCNNFIIDFYNVIYECNKKSDGEIYCEIPNKVSGKYTFNWSNGTKHTNEYPSDHIKGLEYGNYRVTVTDDINGCIATGVVYVPRNYGIKIYSEDPCGYYEVCKNNKDFFPLEWDYDTDPLDCRIRNYYCPTNFYNILATVIVDYEIIDIDYQRCVLTYTCGKGNYYSYGHSIEPYYVWENYTCYYVTGCIFEFNGEEMKYLNYNMILDPDTETECQGYEEEDCISQFDWEKCILTKICIKSGRETKFTYVGESIEPYFVWINEGKNCGCYYVTGCTFVIDNETKTYLNYQKTTYIDERSCNSADVYALSQSYVQSNLDNFNQIPNNVSLRSINSIFSFIISPNPFSKDLTINFSEKITSSITIKFINVLGQKVFEEKISSPIDSYHLNLEKLNKGVYFILLENDLGKSESIKVIKVE